MRFYQQLRLAQRCKDALSQCCPEAALIRDRAVGAAARWERAGAHLKQHAGEGEWLAPASSGGRGGCRGTGDLLSRRVGRGGTAHGAAEVGSGRESFRYPVDKRAVVSAPLGGLLFFEAGEAIAHGEVVDCLLVVVVHVQEEGGGAAEALADGVPDARHLGRRRGL